MISKSDALVLRVVRYSDARWLVDTFTREWGRCTFAVSLGQRGRSSRLRILLQPLTQLEIVCDYRAQQEVQRLKEAQLKQPYISLQTDYAKLSIGLFLAEFINNSTRGLARDTALYDFIAAHLLWLDRTEEGVPNFHLLFTIQLAHRLGMFPNVGDYTEGWVFDLREAMFTPTLPDHADYVPPQDTVHLMRLLRMSIENYRHFRLSQQERNRILDFILLYYRLHIPAFPELRSLDVIRQLFA